MIVRFRVTDFDRWKTVFDRMAATREEHGIASSSVHRDSYDSTMVVTILRAVSLEAARAVGRVGGVAKRDGRSRGRGAA